jgi:hypothetical protein
MLLIKLMQSVKVPSIHLDIRFDNAANNMTYTFCEPLTSAFKLTAKYHRFWDGIGSKETNSENKTYLSLYANNMHESCEVKGHMLVELQQHIDKKGKSSSS